jgi:hypothetical protein
MFPNNSKFLVECFEDAVQKPYGYLLLDLKQDTDTNYRVRTGIFEEDEKICYIEK